MLTVGGEHVSHIIFIPHVLDCSYLEASKIHTVLTLMVRQTLASLSVFMLVYTCVSITSGWSAAL